MADLVRKDTPGAAPRMVGVLCAALIALALPARAAATGTASGPGATTAVVATLSNLKTVSRWAYPQAAEAARQFPSRHARVIGHLHFLTPDGQAEVYLALRSYSLDGARWIEVPLPGRPNGRTGWVPAWASVKCTSRMSICGSTASR